MQILMLSSTFPYPPSRGGTQVRTFNLLKYLSRRHDVILGTVRSPDVTDAQIDELRQQVAELAVFDNLGTVSPRITDKIQRFGRFLWSGTPPNVLSRYSPAMQNWVDELVAAEKCDAVTCEHSVNEIYVRPEWRQKVLTVVNIHSSVWGTCQQMLETSTSEKPLRDRLNLPLLARYEKRYCSKFSRIVATTSTDRRQLFELLSPGEIGKGIEYFSMPTIEVIPNGVDLIEFPDRSIDPGGHTLIFAGAMNNLPNIDAARFLSLEILPIVQQRYPDTTLTLVGTSPVPEVSALGKLPGIQVVGRVQKVAEYLHQAAVCVVPMRIGFGIKNKTLEAMAAGTPVVASDRGLEGLAVGGGPQPLRALRANRVQEYVEAISSLFENPHLRHELSRNARSHIESEYTWDIAGGRYEQL
ncbi:MAG TPA: glycosyl transferase family 1, partial [Microcoleaceae bacterium UBA10368]|nr:glycosyl transferase family 1 [Microcoleaceae cyanobacterium UBA11344]HBK97684.1 glycosyl transferase family 1 [Microcoleaceae cyanobacterium UBA10368]